MKTTEPIFTATAYMFSVYIEASSLFRIDYIIQLRIVRQKNISGHT